VLADIMHLRLRIALYLFSSWPPPSVAAAAALCVVAAKINGCVDYIKMIRSKRVFRRNHKKKQKVLAEIMHLRLRIALYLFSSWPLP